MKFKLQRLPAPLRSIGLYTLGIGVVNGVNFITAPLLIALLGNTEFARWGLLEPILLLGITLAGFGLQTGLMRMIRGDYDADRRAVDALLPFYVSSAVVVRTLFGFHCVVDRRNANGCLINWHQRVG